MLRNFLLLLGLAALAQGYTNLETTCSIPGDSVNFVSSADVRGTLDILWSCIFTIIACTWTIQHLNIPEQREGRDPGWLGDIRWMLKRSWISTKWMITTILAPEILLAKAAGDLDLAMFYLKDLQRLAKEDGVPWTLTHSLFANMGGFVIRFNTRPGVGIPDQLEAGNQNIHENHSPGAQQGIAEMITRTGDETVVESISQAVKHDVASNEESSDRGPKSLIEISTEIETSTRAKCFYLVASDILPLRKAGVLHKLPFLTVEGIKDKSKTDALVRAIAVVQIAWNIVQLIARAARQLAISQLEIAVMAFAVYAIAIYVINWAKPQGVQVPFTLLQYENDIPAQAMNILLLRRKDATFIGYFMEGPRSLFKIEHKELGAPISNVFGNDDPNTKVILSLSLGTMVFGGLHLAAWNFLFPTRLEQIVWWVSSIFCTSFFFMLSFLRLGSTFIAGTTKIIDEDQAYYISVLLCIVLYIVARLFLLVEIFRTLYFLPPNAYVATWASNIPHIA